MRYAFHGKRRDSGKSVDGYIHAANSADAIDRLADKGIIGVYSVRAEPEDPKQLPPPPPTAEAILSELVGKMDKLIGHVETLLTRPAIVAPIRNEAWGAKSKRLARAQQVQDETLRAIFQTNLDLRQSIAKLKGSSLPAPRKLDAGRDARDAAKLVAPPPRTHGRPLPAKQPAA